MTSAIPNSPQKPTVLPPIWCRKHLSPAEQKVVELIASGVSTKEVAAQLGKSTLTTRNQLSGAMRKLGVSSRYELIVALRPLPAPVTEARNETECLEYAI